MEMVSLTSSHGRVIVGWLLVLSLFWFYSEIWCRSQMSLFRHFAEPLWLPVLGCWFTSFHLCAFSYHLGGRKRGTQMAWNGSFWNTKGPSLRLHMTLFPAMSSSIMTVRLLTTQWQCVRWVDHPVLELFWLDGHQNCWRSRCWIV